MVPWSRVPREEYQAFEYAAHCNGVRQRVETIYTFDHFCFMAIINYWNHVASITFKANGNMCWHYIGQAE
jgi:hypothetical protein